MLMKIVPILAVSFYALSGFAQETITDSLRASCPAPCKKEPEPCQACPEPVKEECPKPCPPKPCPEPCPPKPCAEPCPPKPKPKPCPPRRCKPAPCNPCRKTPPRCCWKFNPCNPKGCSDMNCGGFFVSGDFLYWKSDNQGFSYAYELRTTTPLGLNVGDVVRLDQDWAPAFRVALGWNTEHDFWDFSLNYTWYRNRSSQTSTGGNGFIPLWPASTESASQFRSVQGISRVNMDMGEIEVGRLAFLTKSVALKPIFGVKGGVLHQRYISDFTVPFPATSLNQQRFTGKNYYWGIGPMALFKGELHLTRGFSMIGNLGGALLYGKTKTMSYNRTIAAGSSTFTTERQYFDQFYQLVPNLQMAFGFQWQRCFWWEKMFFKASVAWETQYWWNQYNLPFGLASTTVPFPNPPNQALTMEGLTVNMEWSF